MPCSHVTCSNHGECRLDSEGIPVCICDPDYVRDSENSYRCIPTSGCVPNCDGRSCGSDGCGSSCGSQCGEGEACTLAGQCSSFSPGSWRVFYPGIFVMGSPLSEPGVFNDETQHTVTLTHFFAMLTTEVTQKAYKEVMGFNPSTDYSCGQNCPVETVNWSQIAQFCNQMSDAEGLEYCYSCVDDQCNHNPQFSSPYECRGFRLPTETEWEYAARAHTTTANFAGNIAPNQELCENPHEVLDSHAWFCGNSSNSIKSVGLKSPNSWGLYDMIGNVGEFVHDHYDSYPTVAVENPFGPMSGRHVIRGANFSSEAKYCRSGFRQAFPSGSSDKTVGFRIVRTLD